MQEGKEANIETTTCCYLEMLNRLQEAASSVTAGMNNAGSLFEDGRTGVFLDSLELCVCVLYPY